MRIGKWRVYDESGQYLGIIEVHETIPVIWLHVRHLVVAEGREQNLSDAVGGHNSPITTQRIKKLARNGQLARA